MTATRAGSASDALVESAYAWRRLFASLGLARFHGEIPVPRSIEHMRLVWFSAGPDNMEMHFFPGVPDPKHARHLCLEMEDLGAVRRALEARGYTPYDDAAIPNRPRFFCRDPFGNLIEFTVILGDYQREDAKK